MDGGKLQAISDATFRVLIILSSKIFYLRYCIFLLYYISILFFFIFSVYPLRCFIILFAKSMFCFVLLPHEAYL